MRVHVDKFFMSPLSRTAAVALGEQDYSCSTRRPPRAQGEGWGAAVFFNFGSRALADTPADSRGKGRDTVSQEREPSQRAIVPDANYRCHPSAFGMRKLAQPSQALGFSIFSKDSLERKLQEIEPHTFRFVDKPFYLLSQSHS
ncbi:unnamed protein product [Pleuronectes platessa]|uniref:Uncharacterized protein n=1 Tax=Pleuronectes platessa TaxID=8262 RepID=A0A9N7V587_PLEPL|nr:unnamed protein product [Pleuronectes platessa]